MAVLCLWWLAPGIVAAYRSIFLEAEQVCSLGANPLTTWFERWSEGNLSETGTFYYHRRSSLSEAHIWNSLLEYRNTKLPLFSISIERHTFLLYSKAERCSSPFHHWIVIQCGQTLHTFILWVKAEQCTK